MSSDFAARGWSIVRGAVSSDQVAALTAAFDAVLPPSLYAHPKASSPVLEVVGASRAQPAVARYVRDPALGRYVASALGCRRVQLLQDTLLLKPPRNGGRVEWHQDYTYTGFLEPAAMVTIRLALTDCTMANGCMTVLDGSHAWGRFGAPQILTAGSVADALLALPPPFAERARDAQRPVELAAGDLSLHHCLAFHGSHQNVSAHPRKTLIARFVDADCRLVPSRLPSPAAAAHFPTDEDGHLSAAAFPIVYAGD